jgi:hypothetical protein
VDGVLGSSHGGSHGLLDLGEELLDGIEIGAVGRQEDDPCADPPDCLTHSLTFMATEVVEHDDVIGRQGLDQLLFHIGQEGIGIDRAIENPWRIDTVASEGCDESHCPPMAMGNMGDQPRASLAPSPDRGHVGFHPGFVNEHKAARVDLTLMAFPPFALTGQLRPVLFSRQNGFF